MKNHAKDHSDEEKKTNRPEIESHYSRSRLSSMEMDEFYDEYEHPPNIDECIKYGKAMRIGVR